MRSITLFEGDFQSVAGDLAQFQVPLEVKSLILLENYVELTLNKGVSNGVITALWQKYNDVTTPGCVL